MQPGGSENFDDDRSIKGGKGSFGGERKTWNVSEGTQEEHEYLFETSPRGVNGILDHGGREKARKGKGM